MYQTIEDFADKIAWEGGVSEALEYGLRAEDLADTPDNKQFRDDWKALSDAWEIYERLADGLYQKYLANLEGW